MVNKKEMINKTIAGVTGGKEVVAAFLGMSVDAFNNHLYEKKGQRFFSIDELVEMSEFTNTPYIADYFASRVNHIVTEIPEVAELDSVDMFDCHLHLNAVKGLLDKTIEEAKEDGVFDEKERKSIRSLKREYQATFEAFMLKLDALYSGVK
ncbi:YmfL family putative regulatory protein [Vibrio metschnikovii]|uniref:YmfL family putative regulatory protein n=1 Tax=Vibrio metschnikovii TaxID=28172 RepID=UPI001302C695|nr:YmfL family putative regulatory protein [Vibrio metschnikovii]